MPKQVLEVTDSKPLTPQVCYLTIRYLHCCRADEVIDSSTEDVPKRVREITGGKGVDAAVDPVGGELAGQVRSHLCYDCNTETLKTRGLQCLILQGRQHGGGLRGKASSPGR